MTRYARCRLPMTLTALRKSALLCGALALAACAQQKTPTITPVATEPDIVSVKLAQAADKASASLDTIAGIDQMRNPPPPVEDYSSAPSNLMQPVSLRWSGPIEVVTKALTERAGMKFRVKGAIPAVPVVVNVDAYQVPILHILRDIGLQAGHRGTVAVDTAGGAVEVRYAAADRSR